MALEPDGIFRHSDKYTVYSAAGSREILYGYFRASTNEWHGGGDEWNPINGIMPRALFHDYLQARECIEFIKELPDDVYIVEVIAMYLPVQAMEDEDGSVRQEVDGEGSTGSERAVEKLP